MISYLPQSPITISLFIMFAAACLSQTDPDNDKFTSVKLRVTVTHNISANRQNRYTRNADTQPPNTCFLSSPFST